MTNPKYYIGIEHVDDDTIKDELIAREFPNLCDKIKFDLFMDTYEKFSLEQFEHFIKIITNEKRNIVAPGS